MRTFPFVLALVAAVFCGCASTQTGGVPALQKFVGSPSDYGSYPTNCTELVNIWLKVNFKDPDSVKDLSVLEPYKSTRYEMFDDSTYYGYKIPFMANGKNEFGAYGGSQMYEVFVRDQRPLP